MEAHLTMPRKQKQSRVFQDCGGSCTIGETAIRTRSVATPPGFDYTTPNAINSASPIKPRTRTVRKQTGCTFATIEVTARKGKHKGELVRKEILVDKRPECQDSAKPCAGERTEKKLNCPVQLFFRRGQAYLRFCTKQNTPGFIRPVKDAAEAQRIAAEACRCWLEKGKSFKACLPAVGSTLGKTPKSKKASRLRRRGRGRAAA
jgi:hypothetical protein